MERFSDTLGDVDVDELASLLLRRAIAVVNINIDFFW